MYKVNKTIQNQGQIFTSAQRFIPVIVQKSQKSNGCADCHMVVSGVMDKTLHQLSGDLALLDWLLISVFGQVTSPVWGYKSLLISKMDFFNQMAVFPLYSLIPLEELMKRAKEVRTHFCGTRQNSTYSNFKVF